MKFVDLHEILTPSLLAGFLQGPALLPPDGVKSNLADPPNKTSAAIASMAICLILGIVFFGMRLRARIIGGPWRFWTQTEDVLCVLGFIVYIAVVAVAFNMASRFGMFLHQWDVRMSDLASHLYMYHVIMNLYGVTILFVKSAIFLEWTRILVPTKSPNIYWWLLRVLFAVNAIFYVTFMFTINLDCIPYRVNWDHTIDGECWDSRPLIVASGILNLVTDLGIVLIPQIIIWTLHLTLVRRASLAAVFAIGFVAVIASIVRLDAAVKNSMTNDATWWNSKIITWTVAELSCLFIVLSTPSVPQFWSKSHIAEFCKGKVGAFSRRSLPMFRASQIIQLETDKTDADAERQSEERQSEERQSEERQSEDGGNLTFAQALKMPTPVASRSSSSVRNARFSPVPTMRYCATVKSDRAASVKTWRQSSLKPARIERPTTAQTERPASAKTWRHSDMPTDIHPLLRTERHVSMPQPTVPQRHTSLQTPRQMSIKRKELPLFARPSLIVKPPKPVIVRKAVPSYAAQEQAAGPGSEDTASSCVAEEYV